MRLFIAKYVIELEIQNNGTKKKKKQIFAT